MTTFARTATRMFVTALVTFGLAGVASAKPAVTYGKAPGSARTMPTKRALPAPVFSKPADQRQARHAARQAELAKLSPAQRVATRAAWKAERKATLAMLSPAERQARMAKHQARHGQHQARPAEGKPGPGQVMAASRPGRQAAHPGRQAEHTAGARSSRAR